MIQRISPICQGMLRLFRTTIPMLALAVLLAPNGGYTQDAPLLTRREFCRRIWAELFPPDPPPPRIAANTSRAASAAPPSVSPHPSAVVRAANWLANYQRQYWREVRDSGGLRIFLRPRERQGGWMIRSIGRDGRSRPNSFQGGDGPTFWQSTQSFLANPVATFFDRPRQATLPVVALGWYLLFDRPIAQMEEEALRLEAESAATSAAFRTVPGAVYVWRFANVGLLSTEAASKLINSHGELLRHWLEGKQAHLPRVQEMVRIGLIDAAEEPAMYNLMRGVPQATVDVIKRISNLVKPPNAASATRLLWELSHLELNARQARVRELLVESLGAPAGFEKILSDTINDINLVLRLDNGRPSLNPQLVSQVVFLRALNQAGSPFATKSEQTRNFLSTAFFPLVRTQSGNSDLELHRRLGLDTQPSSMTISIRELREANIVSLHEALAMVEEATDRGPQIEARLERLRSFMPSAAVSALNRPELPRFAGARQFDGQRIEGEEGSWRLIYTDPRFRPLRESFERGLQSQAPESPAVRRLAVDILVGAEATMRGWQELLEIDRTAGNQAIPETLVFRLFGISTGLGQSSPVNPLLRPMQSSISERIENHLDREEEARRRNGAALDREALSLEHTKRCLSGVAEAWRVAVRDHSRWIRENPKGDYNAFRVRALERHKPLLDGALAACGPENQ